MSERTARTGRRDARRVALVLLYQHAVTPERGLPELYERYRTDTRVDVPPYAVTLVEGVLADAEHLDGLIATHAHGWEVERIAPIERAALRIAVYELTREGSDVPVSVAIDEAVRLSKRYASPEAAVFINGILGAVARALGVGR